MKRVLGRVRGAGPGPTLVGVGAIHGNEPAGARALERVLAVLEGRASRLAGDVVALTGNLEALRRGRRFR
ncbi:MAG: succinylglutamate desuccinylase/aspartoacylase family protein, partial [Gemmatimonadetes bacterium]|nr:succinylglutamate desuccinylase/aspartoacylase family protein [Gemmatimonadota bacterium]